MKTRSDSRNWLLIFIMALMILVMFAVRYHAVPYSPAEAEYMKQSLDVDAFQRLRSILICIAGVVCAGGLLGSILTGEMKLIRNKYSVMIGLLIVFTLLSFVFSPYKDLVLKGARDHYESIFVYLSYFAIAGALMHIKVRKKDMENIAITVVSIAFITSIIGILQSVGVNLLEASVLRPFISAGIIKEGAVLFKTDMSVYSLFGNPNYVGSIMTLVIPFTYYHATYHTQAAYRYITWGVFFLSYMTLFLSQSEAGFLSVPAALLVFEIFADERRSVRHWLLVSALVSSAFGAACLLGLAEKYVLIVSGSHMLPFLVVWASRHVLNREFSASPKKIVSGIFLLGIIGVFAVQFIPDRVPSQLYIHELKVERDTVQLSSEVGSVVIRVKDRNLSFYSSEGQQLSEYLSEDIIRLKEPEYEKLSFQIEHKPDYDLLMIHPYRIGFFVLENEFRAINSGLKEDVLERPAIYGPKGYENLGSGRIYIWQTAIPLIAHRPFGYGPDAFMPVFPQMDLVGKTNMSGSPYIIVDKVHNTYLQYALNIGWGGAMMYLLLNAYMVIEFSDVKKRVSENGLLPFIAAVSGFIVNGLFNDSKVYTSVYYWILVGVLLSFYSEISTASNASGGLKRVPV